MAETIALWRLLQAASGVVAGVRAGQSATTALERVEGVARSGAQALSFHALRNLGRAQALRQLLAKRPPPPAADALLCTALALCWRDKDAPYEVFTLVDQAVEAAKRGAETKAQANFINACLRRFLRERDALVGATDPNPEAKWNHPRWWIARLRQDWPKDWESILAANNTHAPMTLRVNARKSTPAEYLEVLKAAGIEASRVGVHGIILAKPRAVHALPGFDEGVVSVQDAAAQLAAPLVLHDLAGENGRPDVKPRILDACAAPGGKTAHLLELSDAHVVALDIDPKRCERIQETLGRLGLTATVIAGDARKPADWWDGVPFDAILLDAPCTASGIVRRHPDVRWLRRETDIAQLAAIQARLLEVLWPLLAPGGRLVYCTCSVFRSEGEAQVQTFLGHNTEAVLRPASGHLLPQSGANASPVPDNPQGDHDGFFYAALQKRAQAEPARDA
ncbi:MAG: 16S rRNA (cytosine(967)-C(5))-methyltransferase RsmB [Pseudomonadota bacterium]